MSAVTYACDQLIRGVCPCVFEVRVCVCVRMSSMDQMSKEPPGVDGITQNCCIQAKKRLCSGRVLSAFNI